MSNNFTSGMAGPAAVETLNLLWDRVTEQIVGNSTTSLAIGTGAKTLTIEASKQFAIGQTARITYNSDINKWMQGTVSAYNASTGSISITVDTISGSGTYAVWTVALTGATGPAGPANTTELDDRVLADQQLLGGVAYATDLAGVTARSIAGGDVLLRAGTAGTPSLQAFGDPDTGLFFPAANETAMATAGLERLRLDANGYLGLGTTTPTGLLDVNADKVRVRTAKTPASASAAGNAGEICWDASYLYICTATNTWRRAAHGTW